MKRFTPRNVRTRLTLWYVSILAGVLLVYGAATSALVLHQLRSELDRLAIDDLESVEGLFSFGPNGQLLFRSDYHDHPYPAEMQDRFLEVRAQDGDVLYRNELVGDRALGGPPDSIEGVGGGYTIRSIRLADGTPVRVISKRHVIEGRPTLIRVGFSEEPLWNHFWQVAIGMIFGLPFALGLAGIGGYVLAKHALSPIERMARRVHEINAERLSARLDIENPNDELGLLASAFNETLGRLEQSFSQLRQFTSDASHELRTPLTAIRSVGEVGLQKESGAVEDYREVIASMLEESVHLSRLVDSLLTIARADSGQIQLERTTITLLPFVHDLASLLDVLAEEKGQKISVFGDSTVQVQADRAILRHVLTNLLDNAIKYSCAGGHISISVLRVDEQKVAVDVEDSCPGIPPEHRDRIFDRFYRIDEGRARDAGGTGLGLAIAKWGAEAHGGHLELLCPKSTGCVFRLVLPDACLVIGENTSHSPKQEFEPVEATLRPKTLPLDHNPVNTVR